MARPSGKKVETQMDRMTLVSCFMLGLTITLQRSDGTQVTGYIASLEREDGSGYLFNVNIHDTKRPGHPMETVFVRCLRP